LAKAAAVLFAIAAIFTMQIPASADPLKLVALTSDTSTTATPATIDPATGVVTPLGTASLPFFGISFGNQFTTLVTHGTHAYFPGAAAADGRTNTFNSLNLKSGAVTKAIDSSSTNGFINGLGWDPVHGQLVALVSDVSSVASVADINPTTGMVTPLGTASLPFFGLNAGNQFTSLVTNGTHAYFAGTAAAVGRTNTFYSLDLSTGALTQIIDSSSTSGLINGLGWDPVHDQLLALVSGISSTASFADIDPATGAITPLGTASLPFFGINVGNQFTTLLTDGSHAYFPGTAAAEGRTNTYYSFDLSTGALTSIIDSGGATDPAFIDALGIVPETRGSAVPEPASGLYLIFGFLIAICIRYRLKADPLIKTSR